MKLSNLYFKLLFVTLFLGYTGRNLHAIRPEIDTLKSIKIGLLIPDNNSLAARQGAEMAVRVANENGGYNSIPFQMVLRSMEGPWGTGSKQAVNLIFDENVRAILGSHDGRNAHLVEQVSTKSRIVFLSAWASDPTLAQAFVPWYFSCVPTDLQQADALINEIYNRRKLVKIATVSDKGYDSKLAVESLTKRIKAAGQAEPLNLFYDSSDLDYNEPLLKISKAGIQGIILFGKPSSSLRFLELFEKRKMKQPVFGAISLLDEDESSMKEQEDYRNMVLFVSGNWTSVKGIAFRKEYKRLYGSNPGAVAAYSYDGMSILIEAIRKAGTDRENIQRWLSKARFDGVTGPIQFDSKGKRIGTLKLMELKNGVPVAPER
jgi:branched-chain amino acid transport system substrate-binding protein